MKHYNQFKQEMTQAISNLQEAEGFKSSGKKKKKLKFGTKRSLKVQALKQRPELWSGLESKEVQ